MDFKERRIKHIEQLRACALGIAEDAEEIYGDYGSTQNVIEKSNVGEIVAFHNHPASMPPSVDDINAALQNGYGVGYALCHNGKIFQYTASTNYIDLGIYERRIEYFKKKGYNEYQAQIETMNYLSDVYSFSFKEVK